MLNSSFHNRIQWKQNPATAPDPFQMLTNNAIDATICHTALINIPNLSPDGNLPIQGTGGGNTLSYQTEACGNDFGLEGGVAQALVCEYHFKDCVVRLRGGFSKSKPFNRWRPP